MQPFNRIINGAMTIDQRNAGAAVTGVGTFPVDRFQFVPHTGGGGAASAQQVLDGPDEFPYSTKLTVTTAGSGDLYLVQNIEANNLLSVGYGTPTAKQTTLSFWVKSSIAGIQSVFLYRPEVTRAVTLSYTINQSATWEYKTIVIPSDTTGANTRTNTTAVTLHWFVSSSSTATENTAWKAVDGQRAATGQVALASTLNATWQITGVQLEAGSTASPFAHENVGDTLRKCQRYYEHTYPYGTAPGSANGGIGADHRYVGRATQFNYGWYTAHYRVEKRASATVTIYSYVGTANQIANGDTGADAGAVSVLQNGTTSFLPKNASGGTTAEGAFMYHFKADSEL
jgi:hypothetical protein